MSTQTSAVGPVGGSAPAAPAKSDLFPPGVPYIVANEGAERFSFYGMKAILKIYLIGLFVQFADQNTLSPEVLGAAKAQSTQWVHLFVAGVYAFPLIGAPLADRFLGKYRVILWVSLIYCIGHAVLAVATRFGEMAIYDAARISMCLGLFLIAVGSGGIKPCVSANVGDQFTAENGHLVSKVFQIFYFIINFGSFFSTIITPFLLNSVGPEIAFGVPGILMGVATLFFWMGRDKFVKVAPRPGGKLGLFDSLVTTLLFSPFFALILGYFVLWEPFVEHAQEAWTKTNESAIAAAKAAGTAVPEFSQVAAIGPYFAHHWWLPVGTVALVVLGFILFGARQKRLPDRTSFLPVLLWAIRNQSKRQPGDGFFDPARREFGEEAGDGPPAVLKIALVFSMVSVFWALFDQHASTWVDQARQMNLGLFLPGWLWYWLLFPVTLGLSVFAAVWLFKWIGNDPLSPRTVKLVLGSVGVMGLIAVALDAVGPPAGNRVVNVVVKADSKEALKGLNEVLSDKRLKKDVPVEVVVVSASDGEIGPADIRRAVASRALLAEVRLPKPEAAASPAATPAPAASPVETVAAPAATPAPTASAAPTAAAATPAPEAAATPAVAVAAAPPTTSEVATEDGGKIPLTTFHSDDQFLAEIERRRAAIAAEPRPRWISKNMDAAQLSALNPLMVMLIIPGLSLLVFGPLRKRGVEVKPLQKMTAGMFLAAGAFAAAAVLQLSIERLGDGVVHGLWQAVPYFIITTAEVLVSITGLEFAYTQAPRAMKSTLMSVWLLCVTFGNLIVAFLAPLQKTFDLSMFFWVFTGLMAGAALIFAVMAYFYRGKSYLQQASSH